MCVGLGKEKGRQIYQKIKTMKSMFIPIFAALFLMLAPSSSFTSFAPMKVHRSPLFAASKDTEAVKKVSSESE